MGILITDGGNLNSGKLCGYKFGKIYFNCTHQFLFIKFSIMKEMEMREKWLYKNVYDSIHSSKYQQKLYIMQIPTEVVYNEILCSPLI